MQSISLTYKAELASEAMNKRIHELVGGNVILKGYNVVPGPGTRAVNITGAVDNESVLFINGAKVKETSATVQTMSFSLNSSGSTRYDTIYAYYEYGVSSMCEYRVVQGSTDAPSPNVTCKIATIAIPSGSTTVSAGNIALSSNNRISDMASLSRIASPTIPGLMSSTLFNKLTNIADGANNYTHPSSSGNKHIPSGGASGKILGWLSDGTASWIDTSISLASPTIPGLMSSTLFNKLTNIADGANNYTHPSSSGNKHIPSGGASGKILGWLSNGTASWIDPIDPSISLASPTIPGLMSSTLFNKLTNIADGANNYTHPSSSGNKHIPSGGASGKILGWLSDGTASWIDTPISYTHPSTSGNKHIPSGGVAGKLLGWLSNGTATWVDAPVTYTHPSSHPATIITQTASYRFVTDTEKAAWNGKANASHGTHLPALQTANNAIYLRNDNTWQTITPAKIGAAETSHIHSYLPLSGGTINGNLTVTGTIQGSKVYNAVWNDYAELFKIDDLKEEINPGDIVELNPETGDYRKSKKKNSNLVVGVVSDQYGHLLGGDYGLSEEDNLKTHAAIGLAGRVFVNVVGPVNAGDLIASSDIAGVGMSAEHYSPGCIVGKALETKKTPNIGKVKILIINR